MENIIYYCQQIDESYNCISKYEKQISGLKEFLKESKEGEDQFSIIINQRRRIIMNSLTGPLLKHPMVKKLNNKLSNAIDSTYENNVLCNFQSLEGEILTAINKLENQIEEVKYNISFCERRICEIGEEERRKEEAK